MGIATREYPSPPPGESLPIGGEPHGDCDILAALALEDIFSQ